MFIRCPGRLLNVLCTFNLRAVFTGVESEPLDYLVITTAWKVSECGDFSGPYFPVFGLNTEIYGVNLRIQSDYRKIRTRKSSVFTQCTWTKLEQHFPNAQFNINGYEIRKIKDRDKHGWRLREFLRQGFISKRMEE